MNKVILCGRLTRDPEVRYTQSNMAIARYTLAVDRRRAKEGEQTADFIACTVFDKGAEFAEKYLRKGTKIIASGRIQTGSYTDKDGKKVYTTDVIVEDQEFAGGKGENTPVTDEEKEERRRAEYEKTHKAEETDFMPIPDSLDDEGLPFA